MKKKGELRLSLFYGVHDLRLGMGRQSPPFAAPETERRPRHRPHYLSKVGDPEVRQSRQILHPLIASEATNNPTHIQVLMPATTIGKSKTTEIDGTMKNNLSGICTTAKNTANF